MVSVVIQAGGKSRRMGEDKGLIPFRGKYLIQSVIGQVETVGDELLITSNTPERYAFLGMPVFADYPQGGGALAGLYTALDSARGDQVIVVGCDMPFVNRSLLEYERQRMADEFDVVVPFIPEGMEPFHAVYRRESCLEAVRSALDAGNKKVTAWFTNVRLYKVAQDEISRFDPLGLAFFNVNSRADLVEAERIASTIPGGAG